MSKCYIVQRFVGTVAQRSWLLLEQDRAFVSISIRDEVATWVYERSMQSNSVTLLWANIAYICRISPIRYIGNIVMSADVYQCADTSVEL